MKVHDTTGNVLGHVTIDDRDGEVHEEGSGASIGWIYKPIGDRGWITEDRGTHTTIGHATRKEGLRWLWHKRQEVLKTRKAKRDAATTPAGQLPPTILGEQVQVGDRIRFGFGEWAREITVAGVDEVGYIRDHLNRNTLMLRAEGSDVGTSVNVDSAVELLHRP